MLGRAFSSWASNVASRGERMAAGSFISEVAEQAVNVVGGCQSTSRRRTNFWSVDPASPYSVVLISGGTAMNAKPSLMAARGRLVRHLQLRHPLPLRVRTGGRPAITARARSPGMCARGQYGGVKLDRLTLGGTRRIRRQSLDWRRKRPVMGMYVDEKANERKRRSPAGVFSAARGRAAGRGVLPPIS